MKKLSFFLMAMLFSVMSFAQDAPIYELVPASGSGNSYAGNCDITIDGITWNLTGNSTMQPWRIGGKSITNQDRALYSKTPLAYNIDKIEVIHGTANSITVNSFKLIISDEANGAGETIDVAFKASATTTIDLPEGDYTNKYFKFLYNVTVSGNTNRYVQFTGAKFYAVLAEDAVKAPIIDGDADFISETEVTIKAEDDVTVYYTLDGTEPTTASTVYAAPFTVKETTTVKAIAYRGETASFVTSATFTQATRVTAAEAAELAMKVASNNALTSVTYVINAYVTEVIDQALSNGQQRFWVADTKDGGQVLQSYYCNVPQVLKVGDYIQMFGKLTKYNTNPQMKNGDVTIAEEPVIEEPTIECKDALDFGAVAYNAEVAAQTLEVTGYNLTSDITVTLSEGAAFTVDQTTLSAEGGNLVVTPVSPLTVGTHTATLTLASGEATAEVTLTIVAKDVYTITWSVNGETTTTSVVEGDKLVLPAAPEAPDACSEKVFVGWTAAEEVNADGSDIEWVTAATVPTADATYYAVFAVQEGEGGASEVVDVLDRALTGVEGTNYASWADVSATSDAVYAGQSAGGNEAIQLRSNNSNSGVISTTSAGKLAKVTVAWNSNTASGRTLNIYGSNTAYASPTDLYGDASGEKLGTIVNGTSTELVIEGDYAYVGLRSNSGAMYLDEIQITWTTGTAATYTDYSTTCEAPVVNHTITVSANPAEGGVVTGGGEYEEGATANLTATANEGYEFVNWTENEVEVSTDAEYTFEVLADRALVANFKEVEPVKLYLNAKDWGYGDARFAAYFFEPAKWVDMTKVEGETYIYEVEVPAGYTQVIFVRMNGNTTENNWDNKWNQTGNLTIPTDGRNMFKPDDWDGKTTTWSTYTPSVKYTFTKGSTWYIDFSAITGKKGANYPKANVADIDYSANAGGTVIPVTFTADVTWAEGATFIKTEEGGWDALTFTTPTEGANCAQVAADGKSYTWTTYVPVVIYTVTATAENGTVEGAGDYEEGTEVTLTATAAEGYEFVNWTSGETEVSTANPFTFTITSDTTLVANFKEVEPEVIAYELNGGELPAPAVPTNEELWIAFMPYYQEYYDVVRAEQPIASVAVFLSAGMGDDATIFTSEDSDYKWLGDYIIKVTTEQSAALTTLANWKFNAQAFFNANQYTGWPKSADFTEAGKPENWGAAYEAAHEVVLPTKPVAEDYVLPTPVKEGYKFVGWYDNAEGAGDAYTVIPAGWSGTLYAIWEVEGPATALENIAVEGKAVKAIVNGQLIIIKNGVQYNAQGAVVK